MLKHLLVDLDGVLRHWRPTNLAYDSLTERDILDTAFEPSLLNQAITGKITDEQWRETITQRLSKEHGERARLAVNEWSRRAGEFDYNLLSELKQLPVGNSINLLTNATTRLRSDLKSYGVIESFSVVFNSSEIGFAKPSPEIFNFVIEALNASPREIAFVDDSITNVESAAAMGIASHHYIGFDKLKPWLVEMLGQP
jgi:putative hydrolase of the HAD superfamily